MTTTSNCSLMESCFLVVLVRSLMAAGKRQRVKSKEKPALPFAIEREARSLRYLHPKQHAMRVFQLVLDVDQEQHRVLAIDDAVVVGQRDVHHRRSDDLAVFNDGTLLDGVHAQ